jgi:hypothetical protein
VSDCEKWRADISVDAGGGKSKKRYLGSFVDEKDAALAYDKAAREHHGDKAKLNFPDQPPQPQAASSKTPSQARSQYRGKSRYTQALESLPGAGQLATSSQ